MGAVSTCVSHLTRVCSFSRPADFRALQGFSSTVLLESIGLAVCTLGSLMEGDCYEAAGEYMMRFLFGGGEDILLVHGEVTGQGPLEGLKYGHAWVEKGDTVIDLSNGRNLRMPKALYYQLGRIGSNVHKYTMAEFRRKVSRHKHWGPWDLKTESGL